MNLKLRSNRGMGRREIGNVLYKFKHKYKTLAIWFLKAG